MPTIITTLDKNGNPIRHEAQEDVSKAVIRVNQAVSNGHPFVAFTGPDGKEFSVQSAAVDAIREE